MLDSHCGWEFFHVLVKEALTLIRNYDNWNAEEAIDLFMEKINHV